MKPGANPPKIIGEKCNACGQCVSVCPSFVIDLVGEKARVMRADWCIGCGHCGAVCPTEAVHFDADLYGNPSKPGARVPPLHPRYWNSSCVRGAPCGTIPRIPFRKRC